MRTNNLQTMFEWVFKPDSSLDKLLHYGVGGLILSIIFKDYIQELRPSVATSSIICLIFALILALPAISGTIKPRDYKLKYAVIMAATAYLFMFILYFLNWTKALEFGAEPKFYYDATTDLISTLLFVGVWYLFSAHEADMNARLTERVALVIFSILVIIAGIWKLTIEIRNPDIISTYNYDSIRLMLNFINGAIFLSLFSQMRRILPPPDPLSNVLIILYGCSQIAAHGSDCINNKSCTDPTSIEMIVASIIAWSLLLGKIAFGTYLSYIYFNAKVNADIIQTHK